MSAVEGLQSQTSAAWSLDDRIVHACVEQRVLGQSDHPVQLGRYRVERGLGAGGMGRLLLATDPDLQRRVALKLITPAMASSVEARARIVAEARTMARMSDPHVAQVYEVSEQDGQLFVAIEYIEGDTLSAWLAPRRRPWRQVLAIFAQAGAGLAAAHDKGVTHRDFKPDNVMIDADGRARVVDFGLSRATAEAGSARAPSLPPSVPMRLTRTGAMVGTPAYMAPEQWEVGPVDPRTDQFAWCVAAFEALSGAHPFGGQTVAQTRRALTQPLTRTWPRTVPRWIYRALARGLEPNPSARWPDMRSLLRAVDPSRRRGRIAIAGTIGLTLAAGGVGVLASGSDRCVEADAALDAVWGDVARASVHDALTPAPAHWANAGAAALLVRLDAHADAWRVAAHGICGALDRSAKRGAASTPPQTCLEHARRMFATHVHELAQGDPAALVGATARTELLADPRGCLDASIVRRPAPREALDRLADAERSLGQMWVGAQAGAAPYADAVAGGHLAALAAVQLAEDNPEVLARAQSTIGRLHLSDGNPKRAESSLRRGLAAAREAGHAPLAAALTVELIYAVSRDRERFVEAEDLAADATGMVTALGSPPILTATLWAHRASSIAHAREGDTEAAVVLQTQARDTIVKTLGPDHPFAVAAQGNLGVTLNYAGRSQEAEARLTEAIANALTTWGPLHPRTAGLYGALGMTRLRRRDFTAAEEDLRRALQIRERTLDAGHALIDDARYNLATALRRQQRHDEALQLLVPGRDSAVARLGPDDGRLGPWWVSVGESWLAVDDADAARAALREALRIFERTGATAGDYARVRLGLARAWRAADPARARALAELARADAREAGALKRQAAAEAFLAAL